MMNEAQQSQQLTVKFFGKAYSARQLQAMQAAYATGAADATTRASATIDNLQEQLDEAQDLLKLARQGQWRVTR